MGAPGMLRAPIIYAVTPRSAGQSPRIRSRTGIRCSIKVAAARKSQPRPSRFGRARFRGRMRGFGGRGVGGRADIVVLAEVQPVYAFLPRNEDPGSFGGAFAAGGIVGKLIARWARLPALEQGVEEFPGQLGFVRTDEQGGIAHHG